MSTSLLFHNVLDDELFSKIGYVSQPLSGQYIDENNEERDLTIEPLEGQETVFQIVDPKVNWDPDIHNLILNQEIEIQNPMFLFNSNGGLVTADSKIGIAFRWYSKDSNQYNVYPFGSISYEDKNNKFLQLNIKIPRGSLRGKVTFDIILYLLEKGPAMSNIVTGTVLGVLERKQILLDGDASMFPIVEVNDPLKPLWWVICNFDEPLIDPFNTENVAIVINTGHKHAKHLKIERGLASSPLLLEIVANGLQLIVQNVKDSGDWEEIQKNHSEPGSIGEAIYYFINTFSWDLSSPENLARSIREDFDSRFK